MLLFKVIYSRCKPNKLDLTAKILGILACGQLKKKKKIRSPFWNQLEVDLLKRHSMEKE